jgi:hypothetical protein
MYILTYQPDDRVSVRGEAKTLFGSPLKFEVRSGISTAKSGHVLTFPGLEVALNRDLGIYVPVVPKIDLSLGHHTQFTKIDIDGDPRRKTITLGAKITITPNSIQPSDLDPSSKSISAMFSTDMGRWLTNLGNFH